MKKALLLTIFTVGVLLIACGNTNNKPKIDVEEPRNYTFIKKTTYEGYTAVYNGTTQKNDTTFYENKAALELYKELYEDFCRETAFYSCQVQKIGNTTDIGTVIVEYELLDENGINILSEIDFFGKKNIIILHGNSIWKGQMKPINVIVGKLFSLIFLKAP